MSSPSKPCGAPSSASPTIVRPMQEGDASELLRLMKAIVTFERGSDFILTEEDIIRWGFGKHAMFGAFVAEASPGILVGMAAYYTMPFMHNGRPRLMMKWLYVDSEQRGGGVGRSLMQAMAGYARSEGFQDFRWFVLKDNYSAQKFYRSVGAQADVDWELWSLPEVSLKALATDRAETPAL